MRRTPSLQLCTACTDTQWPSVGMHGGIMDTFEAGIDGESLKQKDEGKKRVLDQHSSAAPSRATSAW
eukprot:m.60722 g.60722  ORF g.60722 m.60722 type:complete len:67 (+) comp17479_c0_seq3:4179-4379(+)